MRTRYHLCIDLWGGTSASASASVKRTSAEVLELKSLVHQNPQSISVNPCPFACSSPIRGQDTESQPEPEGVTSRGLTYLAQVRHASSIRNIPRTSDLCLVSIQLVSRYNRTAICLPRDDVRSRLHICTNSWGGTAASNQTGRSTGSVYCRLLPQDKTD